MIWVSRGSPAPPGEPEEQRALMNRRMIKIYYLRFQEPHSIPGGWQSNQLVSLFFFFKQKERKVYRDQDVFQRWPVQEVSSTCLRTVRRMWQQIQTHNFQVQQLFKVQELQRNKNKHGFAQKSVPQETPEGSSLTSDSRVSLQSVPIIKIQSVPIIRRGQESFWFRKKPRVCI